MYDKNLKMTANKQYFNILMSHTIEKIVYPINVFLAFRDIVPAKEPSQLISKLISTYLTMDDTRLERLKDRVILDTQRCFVGKEHEPYSDEDIISKFVQILNSVSKTKDIDVYVKNIHSLNYSSDSTNLSIIEKISKRFREIVIDCMIFVDQFILILKGINDHMLTDMFVDTIVSEIRQPKLLEGTLDETAVSRTHRFNTGNVKIAICLFANDLLAKDIMIGLIDKLSLKESDIALEQLRLEMLIELLNTSKCTDGIWDQLEPNIIGFAKYVDDVSIKARHRIMISNAFEK